MTKWKWYLIVSFVGVLSGVGIHFLPNKEAIPIINTSTKATTITIPEEGIKTNAFGIKLLQLAQEQEPTQSIIVAPEAVQAALHLLALQTKDKTREEIQAVIGSETSDINYGYDTAILLAADNNLPFTEQGPDFMRLPFKSNFPHALSLFNMTLNQLCGSDNLITADARLMTPDTRLALGIVANIVPNLEQPFQAGNSISSIFANNDGSMPSVYMMRNRAYYRTATAEDGSWEAVAMMLRQPRGETSPPLAFIAILPTGKASDMVEHMTPEQLTSIRKALAEASPTDCCVHLPRMVWNTPMRDYKPILHQLGIRQVLSPTARDWRIINKPIGLDTIPLRIRAEWTDDKTNRQADPTIKNAAKTMIFNKPFIWLLGDLTTEAPPRLMGVVQNAK